MTIPPKTNKFGSSASAPPGALQNAKAESGWVINTPVKHMQPQGNLDHLPKIRVNMKNIFPSKIEWDLTNGPLSKLVELLDTRV